MNNQVSPEAGETQWWPDPPSAHPKRANKRVLALWSLLTPLGDPRVARGTPCFKNVCSYVRMHVFIYLFSRENPFLAGGEAASRGQRLPAYPQCCGGGGAVVFPTHFSATFLSQPSSFALSWDATRHFRSVEELPPGLLGVAPVL